MKSIKQLTDRVLHKISRSKGFSDGKKHYLKCHEYDYIEGYEAGYAKAKARFDAIEDALYKEETI